MFHVVERVADAARETDVQWFIIGAYARILLIEQNFGLPAGQATRDIDFAVMVESWEEYDRLRERICAEDGYRPDAHAKQRIRHHSGAFFDIVPYGGIARGTGEIRWRPDEDPVMNVMGLKEAYDHAYDMTVNGSRNIPVVRPSCFLMLKLFAWDQRGRGVRGRDAYDIAMILRFAERFVPLDDFYEQHLDVLEAAQYDLALAAPFILGNELSHILTTDTQDRLRGLIDAELVTGTDSRLVSDLHNSLAHETPDRLLQLLTKFRDGISSAS